MIYIDMCTFSSFSLFISISSPSYILAGKHKKSDSNSILVQLTRMNISFYLVHILQGEYYNYMDMDIIILSWISCHEDLVLLWIDYMVL